MNGSRRESASRVIWVPVLIVAGTWLMFRFATDALVPVYGDGLMLGTSAGVWLAAFLTLCVLSFLYRDNPLYKLAEHIFVGVSAAYWMVVGFWTTLIPNLLGRLFPAFVQDHFMPDLKLAKTLEEQSHALTAPLINVVAVPFDEVTAETAGWYHLMNWTYWFPMILGILLLWRLAPRGGWISRWALAFILGTTAGLRLVAYLESDFIAQIRNTLMPLVALEDVNPVYADSWPGVLNSIIVAAGVFCGLVYFFFSVEHKGVVGKVSRVGIWVLMITFGAGFGYTVMGRIALLVGRFQFLLDDWLWLIGEHPPAGA